jgi:hypothetical protein
MKPIVLYIDEEEMALHTLGKRLRRCFGDEVDVVTILPSSSIKEMIEKIEKFNLLVSIVIDQKLFAAGTANYVGTDLATVVRKTDPKIPIYILTNFVDDVDGQSGDIEYVLAKDDISDDGRLPAISNRVRRHINIFQSVLQERELRFELLLRKGHEVALSAEEVEEFKNLSFERERKIAVAELLDGSELEKKLDIAESVLAKISASLKY